APFFPDRPYRELRTRDTPAALPYPILRRLASTNPYCARACPRTHEPRPAGLRAARAGRTRCPGYAAGASRGAADEGRWGCPRVGRATRQFAFPPRPLHHFIRQFLPSPLSSFLRKAPMCGQVEVYQQVLSPLRIVL